MSYQSDTAPYPFKGKKTVKQVVDVFTEGAEQKSSLTLLPPLLSAAPLLLAPSVLPKEQSNVLLLERVVSDRNRIREIVNQLLTTS